MQSTKELISGLEKRPKDRCEQDIEIIASHLKKLSIFQDHPEDILEELSSLAIHRHVDSNTPVVSPGAPVTEWFVVVSGELEVYLVDSKDVSKTTEVCVLGPGNSFGEVSVFGTSHCYKQALIITCEDSDIIAFGGEEVRRIYEAHPDHLDRELMCCRHDEDLTSELKLSVMELCQVTKLSTDDEDEDEVQFIDDVAKGGGAVGNGHVSAAPKLSSAKGNSGKDLVDWLLAHQTIPLWTRTQVSLVWQVLLNQGMLKSDSCTLLFQDSQESLYRFQFSSGSGSSSPSSPRREPKPKFKPPPMDRSYSMATQLSSEELINTVLEKCVNTIVHEAPNVLTVNPALRKRPCERTAEDNEVIADDLKHIKAFIYLPDSLKRRLSSCVYIQNNVMAGNHVCDFGEEANCWYIILKGALNVYHDGEILCTLHAGNDFGKSSLNQEGSRRPCAIRFRHSNCALLRVDKDDFSNINSSLAAHTVQLEDGWEVVIESSPSRKSQLLSDGSFEDVDGFSTFRRVLKKKRSLKKKKGYSVKRAAPVKILDHLMEVDIDVDESGRSFAEDFFLTYPSFMEMNELCKGLLDRYIAGSDHADSSVDVSRAKDGEEEDVFSVLDRRRNIAKHVSVWIQTGSLELSLNPIFKKFCLRLQELLRKDLLKHELEQIQVEYEHYREWNPCIVEQALSKANKESTIFSVIKSLISGRRAREEASYILPPQSPMSPLGYDRVSVHTPNKKQVAKITYYHDDTVRSLLIRSCQQLSLQVSDCELCELDSEGRKILFKPGTSSVPTKSSVNGRLFVLPVDSPKKLPQYVLLEQNQGPTESFPFGEHSKDIAAHLTYYDWNLFLNIPKMEFIYQAFEMYKMGKVTANLDLFTRQFNQVYAWVITEVITVSDLARRARLLSKFIKIANHCLNFKNLSSFLAIVLALDSISVSRMKRTWKEVHSQLLNQYHYFKSFSETASNFKHLRDFMKVQEPPIIPYLPVVLKDEYFIHLHNNTFTGGDVNFEKMNMMASSIKSMVSLKRGALPKEVFTLVGRSQNLQKYIRNLKVIDNGKLQLEMSHLIEPKNPPT